MPMELYDIVMQVCISILAGIIAGIASKKTGVGIASAIIIALLIFFVQEYRPTGNTEEIKYENFSIPPLSYKVNYGMKRADLLKLFENKSEEFFKIDELGISIEKYWISLYGILGCDFKDGKLIRFYWTRVKQNNEVFIEKENMIEQLDSYYGEKEVFEEDGNYCWKEERCVVTLTAEEDNKGEKYYLINWYEPNYFYNEIDPERESGQDAE